MLRDNYHLIFPMSFIFMNLMKIILCNDLNNLNNLKNEYRLLEESTEYVKSFTTPKEIVDNGVDLDNDSSPYMMWSQLLETYVLSQSTSNRSSKDFSFKSDVSGVDNIVHPINSGINAISNQQQQQQQQQQIPFNYQPSVYKRPGIYINQRDGGATAAELQPHKRPPMTAVPAFPAANPQFRPRIHQMVQHQQPGFLHQFPSIAAGGNGGAVLNQYPNRPVPLQYGLHGLPNTFRAVSENDLYLLGAIEKLVYRVDYLESRVRRTEQLIYYLMAGNNQKEVRDPCPSNFTRLNENCYYFNNYKAANWKTANTACKALRAHLAEFEKPSENEVIVAYLLNQPSYRGRDYWLGGLNPGLLWIWSNSAKPVNPHTNLTSIVMTHNTHVGQHNDNHPETNTTTPDPSINIIDNDNDKADKQSQNQNDHKSIKLSSSAIKGLGRCLRLSYNASKHNYDYYGQECTSRHHYICEYSDKTLDNNIKKLTKQLKIFNDK